MIVALQSVCQNLNFFTRVGLSSQTIRAIHVNLVYYGHYEYVLHAYMSHQVQSNTSSLVHYRSSFYMYYVRGRPNSVENTTITCIICTLTLNKDYLTMYWYVLICIGMYCYPMTCTNMYWYVLLCYGIH